MTPLEQLLALYDYEVADEQIALSPAEPRDSAKLLVYSPEDGSARYDTYANLPRYLPRGALLVFNDTKVIPARIFATRATGGTVEVLMTELDLSTDTATALTNKKLALDEVLSVGAETLTVIDTAGRYRFKASGSLARILEENGRTPIPPYLKKTPLSEDALRTRYQTVFARAEGSIAAPTASLHFTPELLQKLADAGIETAFVTLHVNLGTFLPLTDEALATGQLHEERYEIPREAADAINRAKAEGRPVIPVGTTALRTIESAADASGRIEAGSASTRLFIREGYGFRAADGLMTNFHVPKSSLLMLVAAMIGRAKLFELYELAKQHGFRFFSFGDGMLVLPKK
ncbi:MAG TPA: tRNA preQ1(34) S-adenosylmethionine ribosyltransferase-isomerase QueA [Candidatus Paceibacterota bacterium]|nr:tRNA preQ1(34) S-adenosylmethionine ribosyltransferase-isomerase QueA [Candidatus Paceibacterota bacterium]